MLPLGKIEALRRAKTADTLTTKEARDLRAAERIATARRIREERQRLDEGVVDRIAAQSQRTRRYDGDDADLAPYASLKFDD